MFHSSWSVFIALCLTNLGLKGQCNIIREHDPPASPSVDSSKYRLVPSSRTLNGSAITEDFSADVGEYGGIHYIVQVFDADTGELLCEQDLEPYGTPVVTPSDIVFSASSYSVNKGVIYPNPKLGLNPFYFTPWYGGEVEIKMVGYGCQGYYPGLWEFDDTVTINAAAVELITSDISCPEGPEVRDIPKTEYQKLEWSAGGSGCSIPFVVSNNLSREATFAAIQMVTVDGFYIMINGQKAFLSVQDGQTVLDAPGTPPSLYEDIISVAQDDEKRLSFTDAPSIPIGVGCWVVTGQGGPMNFSDIGFSLKFNLFVMQDADQNGEDGIEQTPIGGSTVIEWGVDAEAHWDGDEWSPSKGQLTGPSTIQVPNAYAPAWNTYGQSPSRKLATFNKDGCWEFATAPVFMGRDEQYEL